MRCHWWVRAYKGQNAVQNSLAQELCKQIAWVDLVGVNGCVGMEKVLKNKQNFEKC